MFDNGLLRKYGYLKNRDGILDLASAKEFSYSHFERGVWKMFGDDGLYYAKAVNKSRMDAEILLSQIYKSAGFSTAVYVPFQNPQFDSTIFSQEHIINLQNYRYVASNNIIDDNTMLAYDYYSNLGGGDRTNTKLPFSLFDIKQPEDYAKYFTKEAVRQLIKMSVFDFASFNFDRHENNYALKIEDGKVVDVLLFDYGASGVGVKTYFKNDFLSVLQDSQLNKNSSIIEVRDNPIVPQFISNQDLANEIGSVNFVETSRDIKNELNYKISAQYVDKLSQSFEETAELLCK